MFGVGLEKIANVLTSFENPGIRTNPRQCTRARHRISKCTRCADNCPTHAISWEGSLKVSADLCNGCGICAAVCPTGAIEAANPANPELLEQTKARIQAQQSIAFACSRYLEQARDRVRFVEVKCIGRLDESILIGAVAAGAQTVHLMDGACADCPGSSGRAVGARSAETCNALLEAFGNPARITLTSQLAESLPAPREDASPSAVSRRAFFNVLARETARTTVVTLGQVLGETNKPKVQEPKRGELPVRLPVKREMLLAALPRLGQPVVSEFESDLWAEFGYLDKCSGCQMCAFFCPTGALSKTEQEGKVGVGWKLSHCTNCRLCQEICYLEGVTLTRKVNLDKVLSGEQETFLMRDASLAHESPDARVKRLLGMKS